MVAATTQDNIDTAGVCERYMTLVELIKQEAADSWRSLLLVAGLSGIANAGLLAIINTAIQNTSATTETFRTLLLFGIVFLLYAVCFRQTFFRVTAILEEIVNQLRVRIAEKIRRTDLLSLEQINQAEIYNLLTSEARVISESSSLLAAALQSAILLAFALVYLALLSLPAFLLCLILIGGGIPTYLSRIKEITPWLARTAQQEVRSFNTLRDLLDGFKEVRLNESRSRDLMSDITATANTLRSMKIVTADMFHVNQILGYSVFYLTVAGVIFLLPRLVPFAKDDMVQVLMTVLFTIGPLGVVITGMQALSKAGVAVHNVMQLEQRLERFTAGGHVATAAASWQDFTTIQLQAVRFDYIDADGNTVFRVGPLDLTISRGEIVFVIGGNGSGKSTLLKLLTALYLPSSGALLVDNHPIGTLELPSYRALFTAIFADFHIFQKLYGLYDVQEEKAEQLLQQFSLAQKTAYTTDHFTNIQLSTGQRKRLAMIVALLEDRPVYVFDEWAADQDPEFRQYFYAHLLPDLQARGKTVIVVTHDERYFHVAHRLIKMELGQIDSDMRQTPDSEVSTNPVA
jgi:putative ATP-binding cassette transporter